ncbi:MAG: TIGR02186 family protein [Sphingobium sp.]|nr:TIGR02186 family protein [Sphingobium sp.]
MLAAPALLMALTGADDDDGPKLVPDVSQRTIDIRYSFSGAELLLFGAILYPDGRRPDRPVDIVVVVKGPAQSIEMREKSKIAGIWVNAASARFRSAPAFYGLASSRPIERVVDARTAAIYELGLDKLQLSPSTLNDDATNQRFENGLVDLRKRNGLFFETPGSVEITDGVLYRARVPLPARVGVGTYTAETFLVQDGRVLAAATRDIHIRKSGFERFIARAAEQHGFVYGLVAIFFAVSMGWVAGTVARRI